MCTGHHPQTNQLDGAASARMLDGQMVEIAASGSRTWQCPPISKRSFHCPCVLAEDHTQSGILDSKKAVPFRLLMGNEATVIVITYIKILFGKYLHC